MATKNSRFAGSVNFSQFEVIEVTPHLFDTLGGGFRCKRREFGTYFKNGKIKREANANICKCWCITHDSFLVGYITLLTDKLEVHQPLLHGEDIRYETFPAVKIGLLAADERAKGVGKRLIEWASEYVATELVNKIGVRFLTVDAFYDPESTPPYDASGYYKKLGFIFSDPNEEIPPVNGYRTMYFDLKPLIDTFNT